jgi:hypothetical protein
LLLRCRCRCASRKAEQKITPFDVQGGVDADGKETGM